MKRKKKKVFAKRFKQEGIFVKTNQTGKQKGKTKKIQLAAGTH